MGKQPLERIELGQLLLVPGDQGTLFAVSNQKHPRAMLLMEGPTFEVDGQARGSFTYVGRVGERELPRGGQEKTLRYVSADSRDLALLVTVRGYPDSSFMRMRYRLSAASLVALTKHAGKDNLRYLTLSGGIFEELVSLTEIQLSHFDPVAHSYLPNIVTHAELNDLYVGWTFAGPIAVLQNLGWSAICAYEHGADHPQSFLEFRFGLTDTVPGLTINATQGNYYDKQPLGPDHSWQSVWFQLSTSDREIRSLLPEYRRFVLDEMCENTASRQPYVYYNTGNFQERNRYWHRLPFLESMHYDRIAAEIDVASRIGIDVFVIDTGWYVKTGDWRVNTERFPDGLKEIKRKLDGHGMRLGLWFDPNMVALTSEIYLSHPEYEATWDGKPGWRGPVWETEESTRICLASPYADYYIETMVRMHDELGVTYFKWDGIGQYGCDSPDHDHGTAANTVEERATCYAYQIGNVMIRIVEEVSRRCPNVIVDFDITEGARSVGLGFLSVGKYFLINNGPYFSDFDIPATTRMEPDTINVFFYPGPARPRVCRQGSKFDSIIPSILFLTHYLPDPPALSQRNSMAALMLGGNGIWGDLLSLSEEDITLLASHLTKYKRVASSVTRAYPRVHGFTGSSPEAHEKIDTDTANGVVIFFTVTPGAFTHITQPLKLDQLDTVTGADAWVQGHDGRLKITVTLGRNDARIVYVMGKSNVTYDA